MRARSADPEDEVSSEPQAAGTAAAVDGQLVAGARAEGLQWTGESQLLQQLTKRVLESSLEGEITDHLAYDEPSPTTGTYDGTPLKAASPSQDLCRAAVDGETFGAKEVTFSRTAPRR